MHLCSVHVLMQLFTQIDADNCTCTFTHATIALLDRPEHVVWIVPLPSCVGVVVDHLVAVPFELVVKKLSHRERRQHFKL